MAIPTFTAHAVRRRLAKVESLGLDELLFPSRGGTPLTTANVRPQLGQVLEGAGIKGVTPHMLRRTVVTAVSTDACIELASEMLGHTDTKIAVQHYIQRSGMVDPARAALLDRAFAKAEECPRC
ncbi:tyrosine-type recombinase/integrase [Okibacterium fritillariae]|uniref:tyrosine-type recombinase/integrase n=1 Tax=Okibacterium fritillariae TaxID=123320 RepID=UPI0040554833